VKGFLRIIEENKINNRPICFFTINDTLTTEGINDAVAKLSEGGFGGGYIHCRSGYTGEYLKDEWFERCDDLVSAMEKHGMEPWMYDEFGWPSGIAGGSVIRDNKQYCQRWLVKNDQPNEPVGEAVAYYTADGAITDKDRASFSLEVVVNTSYVDVLNRRATELFIEETYEKYRLRYGDRIKGFFTDEPQFGHSFAPWNGEIEEYFKDKYGDFKRVLPYLYIGEQGEDVRQDYSKRVANAFIENYIKPISDWCEKYGYKLTGHILEEKDLWLQQRSAGDVMGIYRQMQAPAVDWLGRDIGDMKTPKQVSSVCQRYGKSRSVTESFALIGYGASFDVMKNIVDWQIAGGISNVCNVMGYSLRGRRKRDYPAGAAFVQPYYPKLKIYNDYLSKVCTVPAMFSEEADTLLIEPLYESMKHPVYGFGYGTSKKGREVSNAYNQAIKELTESHVLFHVASPSELADAFVKEGKLVMGKYAYKTVISLDPDTDALLSEKGVEFIKTTQNAQNRIVLTGDDKQLYASVYKYENGFVAMLKNLGDSDAVLNSVVFDGMEYTAEVDFTAMKTVKTSELFIPAKGMKTVLFGEVGDQSFAQNDYNTVKIDDSGFDYIPREKNLLVLDFCNYQTDKESGRCSVITLFERLIKTAYRGKLKMEFSFGVRDYDSSAAELLMETPEFFDVSFNGERVEFNGFTGKVELKPGKNTVVINTDYYQDERLRQILNGELGAEGDFNMLGKLFELENIYLRGDFGVYADDLVVKGNMLEASEFYVSRAKKAGNCNMMAVNGYPYYCGVMTLEKDITVNAGERFIAMGNLAGAADVYIDGSLIKTVLWNEGKILLPEGLEGKHKLRVDYYNTIRNAVGPSHNIYDDGANVGYSTFSNDPSWCDPAGKPMWTDVYRLAVEGIKFYK